MLFELIEMFNQARMKKNGTLAASLSASIVEALLDIPPYEVSDVHIELANEHAEIIRTWTSVTPKIPTIAHASTSLTLCKLDNFLLHHKVPQKFSGGIQNTNVGIDKLVNYKVVIVCLRNEILRHTRSDTSHYNQFFGDHDDYLFSLLKQPKNEALEELESDFKYAMRCPTPRLVTLKITERCNKLYPDLAAKVRKEIIKERNKILLEAKEQSKPLTTAASASTSVSNAATNASNAAETNNGQKNKVKTVTWGLSTNSNATSVQTNTAPAESNNVNFNHS